MTTIPLRHLAIRQAQIIVFYREATRRRGNLSEGQEDYKSSFIPTTPIVIGAYRDHAKTRGQVKYATSLTKPQLVLAGTYGLFNPFF